MRKARLMGRVGFKVMVVLVEIVVEVPHLVRLSGRCGQNERIPPVMECFGREPRREGP